ncbi:MAG: FkbM family methyltransferase [Patescibacteria group bacterium]
MPLKRFLRRFGYDIRRYHSLSDTVLRHHDIKTVLDIGANDGHWSAEMRLLLPRAQIYAFEPLADCFKRTDTTLHGNSRAKAFHMALGAEDGSTEIERSSFHPSSSLRRMTQLHKDLYPKSAESTREKITIRKLDSIMKDLELTPNILIKMDVQGYEDKVIEGGKETFRKAKVVITEAAFDPLYVDQPLFGTIHDMLSVLGFSYHGNCAEHFSPKTGKRLYEDSVFIRD